MYLSALIDLFYFKFTFSVGSEEKTFLCVSWAISDSLQEVGTCYAGLVPEVVPSTVCPAEYSLQHDEVVVGCSAGHPAEVIQKLTQEISQTTALVADCELEFPSIMVENMEIIALINIYQQYFVGGHVFVRNVFINKTFYDAGSLDILIFLESSAPQRLPLCIC